MKKFHWPTNFFCYTSQLTNSHCLFCHVLQVFYTRILRTQQCCSSIHIFIHTFIPGWCGENPPAPGKRTTCRDKGKQGNFQGPEGSMAGVQAFLAGQVWVLWGLNLTLEHCWRPSLRSKCSIKVNVNSKWEKRSQILGVFGVQALLVFFGSTVEGCDF